MIQKHLGSRFYYVKLIGWHEPTSDIAEKWGDRLNIPVSREEISKIF